MGVVVHVALMLIKGCGLQTTMCTFKLAPVVVLLDQVEVVPVLGGEGLVAAVTQEDSSISCCVGCHVLMKVVLADGEEAAGSAVEEVLFLGHVFTISLWKEKFSAIIT